MDGNEGQAVEQPQAGANPAAPAGDAQAPAQDARETPQGGAPGAPMPPAGGDRGAAPEASASGDPSPGGVPRAVATDGPAMGGTPAAPPGPALVVRGPARGRWRVGRRFGPEPTAIPEAELSAEEVDALRGDPELTVHGA